MTKPVDERQPWHRTPKETAQSYGGFRVFRDLGPKRSIAAVVTEYGITDTTCRRWAKNFNWVDRATAWDDHTAALVDEARLSAFREMKDTHTKLAKIAMTKALEALQRIKVEHMPSGTAVRLLEFAVKLDRETLSKTPEEMLGLTLDGESIEDPWDEIAKAFTSG